MVQIYCNMKGLAEIFGLSTQTIRRMLKDQTLIEGVHYKCITDRSNKLYYIPEIVRLFKPENACLYLPMVAA